MGLGQAKQRQRWKMTAKEMMAPVLIPGEQIIDLAGQQFGRLTVLPFVITRTRRTKWLCRCECKTEIVIDASKLRRGHTKSCGCWKREFLAAGSQLDHGDAREGERTKEYRAWKAMKRRCYDPKFHACLRD